MFLNNEPIFPNDFHRDFGFMPDYKGLGVFLYRSEQRGKWFLMAIPNKGLQSVTRGGRSLDFQIAKDNSCEFDLQQDMRGGIRVKVQNNFVYINKKESGDFSYTMCAQQNFRDMQFENFAIVSNNLAHESRISSIDIDSVTLKNNLADSVYDEDFIKQEKLELTARMKSIQQMEDGTYHPADLMAHKMQMTIEEENRKALTFVNETDSKADLLYKHYTSLVSYTLMFNELLNKA